MNLVIDKGNTLIKVAVYDKDKQQFFKAFEKDNFQLRPARTTRQNPHRKPPPAARRKRIGHRRHRRDQRSRHHYLRQTPPNRPDRNHPADSDR